MNCCCKYKKNHQDNNTPSSEKEKSDCHNSISNLGRNDIQKDEKSQTEILLDKKIDSSEVKSLEKLLESCLEELLKNYESNLEICRTIYNNKLSNILTKLYLKYKDDNARPALFSQTFIFTNPFMEGLDIKDKWESSISQENVQKFEKYKKMLEKLKDPDEDMELETPADAIKKAEECFYEHEETILPSIKNNSDIKSTKD